MQLKPNRKESTIPVWQRLWIKAKAKIATIEHLMSALSGLGIDNCYVEVDGAEVPIMDGSGASFVFLIKAAGVEEQDAPRKFVRVKKVN